jgi:hypothetical protein
LKNFVNNGATEGGVIPYYFVATNTAPLAQSQEKGGVGVQYAVVSTRSLGVRVVVLM